MSRLGDSMPPEIKEACTLVAGGAYRQEHQFREGEKVKPRFFFIINKLPDNDDTLIIVTATTKIKKHVARWPRNVLVIVEPSEYDEFTKKSLINCSLAMKRPKAELIQEIRQNKAGPLARLPEAVLEKIRKAVAVATTLSPKDKRLVLGAEEPGDAHLVSAKAPKATPADENPPRTP